MAVFISPITTRQIFKKDPDFFTQAKFGVPALQKSYNEICAYKTAKYNKLINKCATYNTSSICSAIIKESYKMQIYILLIY